MGQRQRINTVFLADSDITYVERAHSDLRTKINPIVSAHTGRDAQQKLSDKTLDLKAIFISSNILNPSGLAVCRFAYEMKAGVPVYFLKVGAFELADRERRNFGIRDSFERPATFTELMHRITPRAIEFDSLTVERVKKEGPAGAFKKVVEEDKLYYPMKAKEFFPGQSVLFNVFVRLDSGKYVKVLYPGDDFSADRLDSYKKKGLTNFFIQRIELENYLKYLNDSAADAMVKAEVTWKFRLHSVLTQGERVIDFLRGFGIAAPYLEHAEDYFKNVIALVRNMDLKNSQVVREFLEDIDCVDHAAGTSIIAGMLMKPMKLESEKASEIIGVTAMFHDIGLFNKGVYAKSKNLLAEEESKLTEEERIIFKSHPLVGSEILSQIRGINPVVIQAVMQHHERYDKSGFPYASGPNEINPIAEIISLADEIHKVIQKSVEKPTVRPFQEVYARLPGKFSPQIIEIYRKVFISYATQQ